MATPEGALKGWMKKQAEKFAEENKLPCRWDQPQPGRFGTRGRPDCYFDIGPCSFRIEVKVKRTAQPSGLQDEWLEDDLELSRYRPILVCGRGGAEKFFAALPTLLVVYAEEQVDRLQALLHNLFVEDPGSFIEATDGRYLEFRG